VEDRSIPAAVFLLARPTVTGSTGWRRVTEAGLVPVPCPLLGGAAETRMDHEIAPDRRWRLDSVRQVLSGASRSGRAPTVVPIDANGVEDGIEYRIETAARAAPVARSAGTFRCAWG